MENPIDDAFNYGITLLAVHNSLQNNNFEKQDSLES